MQSNIRAGSLGLQLHAHLTSAEGECSPKAVARHNPKASESAVVQWRHAYSNYRIKPTMRHLAILDYTVASVPHCGLFER
jgi:hypothetical protein